MAAQVGRQMTARGLRKAAAGGEESAAIDAIVAAIDFTGWAVLVGEIEGMMADIVRDGAVNAMLQVGIDVEARKEVMNVVNAYAVEYAKQRSAELVGMRVDALGSIIPNPRAEWQITDSTRAYLRADVREAIAEGWSNDTLAAKTAQSYGFSRERAMVISRTETIRASNAGSLESYKVSGLVKSKEWLTAEDDKVTPDCVLNGEAGPVALDSAFPSGAMAPPDHPNCRCTIVPVVDWTAVDNANATAGVTSAPAASAPKAPAAPVVPKAPPARVAPPVDFVSKPGLPFRALVEATLAALPDAVMKRLADYGARFQAGERVTQIRPELKGVHPRGWPSGSTWDSADGAAFTRDIVVAETYRPIGVRGFATSQRVAGVLAHETGHVFDRAMRLASRSPEFAKAYTADAKPLRASIKAGESGARRFAYYLQRGEAGPSEAFAEIFAQVVGGGTGSMGSDLIAAFPNVAKYMRDLIAGLEQP